MTSGPARATYPLARPRARALGVRVGRLTPGSNNAITDVPDVRVGHVGIFEDLADGRAIRTGVTVVLPHGDNLFLEKVVACAHVINGFGKPAGLSQVNELGVLETPVALTNTLSVGAAMEGLVLDALARNPEIGRSTDTVNPLVFECNDGGLNDIRGLHVRPDHVRQAIEVATVGPVQEGAVGAGTGMTCYGWKGGIGTSSRVVELGEASAIVGVLVLANFGEQRDLVVAGVAVGQRITPPRQARGGPTAGSCIVVLATDAPLDHRQLQRLSRHAQTGLARTGTYGRHKSGEFVVAFSTARRVSHWSSDAVSSAATVREDAPTMDRFFECAVEATDEAVINALFVADTTYGTEGSVRDGLPTAEVCELVRRSEQGVFGPTSS
ncbi:MAG: P1 family peptidase [Candidatus Dormiibacterota bacterium]